MSDSDTGKVLAWTEEAKYQFLLRIVAQLQDDGKSINWAKMNMPGRTTKSLQNMWTKVRKAISQLEEQSGEAQPVTTPRKRGPRKGAKAKKSEAIVKDEEDDAGAEDTPKKTPKKRVSDGAQKRAYNKKPKKEVVEAPEVADTVKEESAGDDMAVDE